MIACGWCAVGITAAELDDQDDFEVQLPPMVQRNSVKNNQPAANYLVNRDTRDHDGIEPMNWILSAKLDSLRCSESRVCNFNRANLSNQIKHISNKNQSGSVSALSQLTNGLADSCFNNWLRNHLFFCRW